MCHISAAQEWLQSGCSGGAGAGKPVSGGRGGEEESSVGTRHWRRQHGATRHSTVSSIVSVAYFAKNQDGPRDRITIYTDNDKNFPSAVKIRESSVIL